MAASGSFSTERSSITRTEEGTDRGRHSFRSNSDTEVILHLYEKLGEAAWIGSGACSPSASGTAAEELFLARDRLGVKPCITRSRPTPSVCLRTEAILSIRRFAGRSTVRRWTTI